MSKTQKQTTRDRILDAGAQAVVGKSFAGCGLNEILSVAQVPKGSFYHYFRSKEEMGAALVERSMQAQTERLVQCIADTSLHPLDRVDVYYRSLRDDLQERGARCECIAAKLALEAAQLSEPIRQAIKSGYDRWVRLHERAIREAMEDGDLPADFEARRTASAIVNSWNGVAMRLQSDQNLEVVDEFIAFTLRRLLGK